MFTIALVIMIFIAAAYAFRSIVIGNAKTAIDERMINLVDSIDQKKSLADKSKCGMQALRLYEDREKDINSLASLVRSSYGAKAHKTANVYDINGAGVMGKESLGNL
jgi:hypothetical protein